MNNRYITKFNSPIRRISRLFLVFMMIAPFLIIALSFFGFFVSFKYFLLLLPIALIASLSFLCPNCNGNALERTIKIFGIDCYVPNYTLKEGCCRKCGVRLKKFRHIEEWVGRIAIEEWAVADPKDILDSQMYSSKSEFELSVAPVILLQNKTVGNVAHSKQPNVVFKAVLDSNIIGVARGTQADDICYVLDLVVEAKHRKHGVGAALVSAIENRFAKTRFYEAPVASECIDTIKFFKTLAYMEDRTEKTSENFEITYMRKMNMF